MMIDSFEPRAGAYRRSEPKRELCVIFKVSGLELLLSLLNIPIALFSLILKWDNFLVHCKGSSRSTPRYLTDLVGRSRLPWSLNLNEEF